MKKLLSLLTVLTMVLALNAQSTNAPPITEWVIPVNPKTNLWVNCIRVTFQNVTFDPVLYTPVITFNIEGWSEVTQVSSNKWAQAGTCFAHTNLVVSAAALKQWTGDPIPKQKGEDWLVGKFGLVKKTP